MQIAPKNTAHNTTNTLPTVAYAFDGNEFRTVFFNGDPWFIAKDVAEALGYRDTDQAIRKYCKAAITSPVESTGQVRHMRIIPERDVYRLIINSRLQSAERFEEWVVAEVLPSIRKRGMFIMGQQKIRTELLDALAENIREKALPALQKFDRLTEHDHWLAVRILRSTSAYVSSQSTGLLSTTTYPVSNGSYGLDGTESNFGAPLGRSLMHLPEFMFLGALLLWPLAPLMYLICIAWQTDFKLVARSRIKSTEGTQQ